VLGDGVLGAGDAAGGLLLFVAFARPVTEPPFARLRVLGIDFVEDERPALLFGVGR